MTEKKDRVQHTVTYTYLRPWSRVYLLHFLTINGLKSLPPNLPQSCQFWEILVSCWYLYWWTRLKVALNGEVTSFSGLPTRPRVPPPQAARDPGQFSGSDQLSTQCASYCLSAPPAVPHRNPLSHTRKPHRGPLLAPSIKFVDSLEF